MRYELVPSSSPTTVTFHWTCARGLRDIRLRSNALASTMPKFDIVAPLPKSKLRGIFILNADWERLQRDDDVMGSPHRNGGGQLLTIVYNNIAHSARPGRSDTSVCEIQSESILPNRNRSTSFDIHRFELVISLLQSFNMLTRVPLPSC